MMEHKPYELCFGTLSDDLRLSIMSYLLKRPMTIKELSETTGAERSTVSHSMKILKICRMVNSEKKGKNIFYSVNKKGVFGSSARSSSLLEIIDSHINGNCDECRKMKLMCR